MQVPLLCSTIARFRCHREFRGRVKIIFFFVQFCSLMCMRNIVRKYATRNCASTVWRITAKSIQRIGPIFSLCRVFCMTMMYGIWETYDSSKILKNVFKCRDLGKIIFVYRTSEVLYKLTRKARVHTSISTESNCFCHSYASFLIYNWTFARDWQ